MHTMKSPGDANGLIVVLLLDFKVKKQHSEKDLVNGAVGAE